MEISPQQGWQEWGLRWVFTCTGGGGMHQRRALTVPRSSTCLTHACRVILTAALEEGTVVTHIS